MNGFQCTSSKSRIDDTKRFAPCLGKPANWSDGEWNDDGIFDQLDIVAAMQTGTYLAG